jgi:hypothetical protein
MKQLLIVCVLVLTLLIPFAGAKAQGLVEYCVMVMSYDKEITIQAPCLVEPTNNLQSDLDAVGAIGWDLVSAVPINFGAGQIMVIFVFERPL